MSYKQVARLLKVKHTGTVSEWEKGITMPSGTNLLKMTMLYRMEATQLYPDYYAQLKEELKEAICKHRIRLEEITLSHRSTNR